ncbi:MAG: TetR/AcrR family transcriptional regulator, partial [Peptococcaceae bacterium]|nr:TetR/AcrR family transcriptional regulator [Peptococcaceae bacterium]
SAQYRAYSDQGFEALITFIYEHFAAFRMLVNNAPGNYYQDFLEKIVQLDTACTKGFLEEVGSAALADGRLTDGYLHVVSSAFYAGVFEVVIHDMPIDEAKSYIRELRHFYSNGWQAYYS